MRYCICYVYFRVPRNEENKIAHVAVVRKQDERQKLQGHGCKQCLEVATVMFDLITALLVTIIGWNIIFLAFDFCRFCVVIRFCSSPPQRPMTSDFEEFSIPDFIHYIYFYILILEKEPVFSLSNVMVSAKQGNYWYHFYNVFGMTRSLTGD